VTTKLTGNGRLSRKAGTPRHIRIAAELRKNRYLYILAVPTVLFYLLFCYAPMFGLVIAFREYKVTTGFFVGAWDGFKNFIEYFNGAYFGRTLGNTFIISVMEIAFGFPMPLIFALLINEMRGKLFKRVVQTASYLPHFISLVVVCGIISDFFSADGIMSRLFVLLGGENISYIGDPRYFRQVFVWTGVWQGFGWGSIIYLAALAGVDAELYEAARIDGAGRLRQLWNVTLPGIMPTIVMLLILRLGSVLGVGFEKIMLLQSTSTLAVSDVISTYTYRMGIGGGRFSFSTAVGLFQSFVNIIVLFLVNMTARKYSEISLF
jgi:putative aldouronate transport system permease protein